MNIRNKIEHWFERLARVVYRHRLATILILTFLTLPIVCQIPKITIDTSTEGFLHEDDPAMVDYNAFRDQFGRDEVIIVAVKSEDVFDL